ncbi:hypothetical protein BD779DRAFT_1534742, partial [Infundibulicybe gibba]
MCRLLRQMLSLTLGSATRRACACGLRETEALGNDHSNGTKRRREATRPIQGWQRATDSASGAGPGDGNIDRCAQCSDAYGRSAGGLCERSHGLGEDEGVESCEI